MTTITIITASDNHNLALAKKAEKALTKKNIATTFINLVSLNLPLYTPSYQKENGIPETIHALTKTLTHTKSFLFVAPEYNGSIPPSLTNLIAWISVSTKDWRACFNQKTAAIATHSGSGGSLVLAAMRLQLSYIGLNVLGRQIHTHYDKKLDTSTLDNVLIQLIK